MPPISICLLAKNCAVPLSDCLDSLKSFLHNEDEIIVLDTGSTDTTPEVAKSKGAQVISRPDLNQEGMLNLVQQYLPNYFKLCKEDSQFSNGFLSDFSAARAISFEAAKHELVFWIDADDILQNGARLRNICDTFFKDPSSDALMLPYDYSHDSDGACNTILWRERIVRKQNFHWAGLCHETLLPNPGPHGVRRIGDENIRIIHKHARPHVYSDVRNYVIMRKAHDAADWQDPRLQLYLGNACRGLAQGDVQNPFLIEALYWYNLAFNRSGSTDDRLNIALSIAYIQLQHGRAWKAIDWFQKALKVYPGDPRAYYGIAHCYLQLDRYEDTLLYIHLGDALPTPDYTVSFDPLQLTYFPGLFKVLALQNLKRYPEAIQTCYKLLHTRSDHQPLQILFKDLIQESQNDQIKNSIGLVCSDLAVSPTASQEIIQRIRPELRRILPDLQLEFYSPPTEQSVTFLCGHGSEPWDPSVLSNGIGGSEKMVILIARELATRGWNVQVYGQPCPGNEYKEFAGVTYRPIESFNARFERDILILWRSPVFLSAPFKAKKIYVDMHDITNPQDWTSERLEVLTGAFFKSKYHANPVQELLNSKAIISRNAVDINELPEFSVSRNPQKLIWSSSADRGLKLALHAFALVKQKFPQAEFHIFYGFTPLYMKKAALQQYQFYGDEQCERHMHEYQEECFSLIDQHGAKFHGRVGSKELLDHLNTSHIWLYPTAFPEISCMAAMEAQCCGAIPICSGFAALEETVNWGMRCSNSDPQEIAGTIISAIKNAHKLDFHRSEMQAHARKAFNLTDLVDAWEKEFLK